MRRRGGTGAIVCAAVALAVVWGGGEAIAQGKGDAAGAGPSAAKTAFESSAAWQKVDPSLQASWREAMASGDTDRRIDAFVRCQQAIDPGDKSFLLSNGFVVRAASGPIATGHLKAGDLPSVAALPFVVSVKSSTKE